MHTPLIIAIRYGHIDAFMLLIERGANPNIRDKDGNTPLHWASASNRMRMMRVLIDMGVDINDNKNKRNATPYQYASHYKSTNAQYLLIEKGADWLPKPKLIVSTRGPIGPKSYGA